MTLFQRLRGRRDVDRDMAEELSAHLEARTEELVQAGVQGDQALQQARRELGNVTLLVDRGRDVWRFTVEDAWQDLRYACRQLRRDPVFAAAVILTLALGIGLNAAVFTVMDWVLLRPLPYPAPRQLVRVRTQPEDVSGPAPTAAMVTPADFERLSHARSFTSAAAFSSALRIASATGLAPVHAVVARVDGDLFGTLGWQPALGRTFSADENLSGAPVAVLAYGFWQRQFHNDPTIVGRTLAIDDRTFTIVGVMPPRGQYPSDADIWRPLSQAERDDGDRDLVMIARLGNTTLSSADAELSTLATAGLTSPQTTGRRLASVEDLQGSEARDVRAAVVAVGGASGLILLIVCANVASLLGARASARTVEMALRGALGATRTRLTMQLVIEGLTLVGIGGATGLLLCAWTLRFLLDLAPASLPRVSQVVFDWRIAGTGIALTIAIGVVVGMLPALKLSHAGGPLNTAGPRATARSNTRRTLVLLQVAIAVVLTVGAGLFGRSLAYLVSIDNGFQANGLVAIDLSIRRSGDLRPMFRELTTAIESVPGVQGAAVAMQLPTMVPGLRTQVRANDGPLSPVTATLRPVGRHYFQTVGLRIVAGRAFDDTDVQTAPPVGVVNTRFVQDILDGTSAVGMRLSASLLRQPVTIVGVAGDLTPASEVDRPALYVSVDQTSVGGMRWLLVRSRDDYRAIAPVLSARIRAAAPAVASDRVVRVADALEDSRSTTRFSTQLIALLAGLALLLSMIGVYGLASGEVAVRWRELAVRRALGATPWRALWPVLRPPALITGSGALAGVAIAAIVAPRFATLFPGVQADDVTTLAAAPLILVVTGVVAALVASVRVLRGDPAETLRAE